MSLIDPIARNLVTSLVSSPGAGLAAINPYDFDFRSPNAADRNLAKVSASYSGGTNFREFRDGIWQTAAGSYGRRASLAGAPLGRIIEPAVTNLVLYSSEDNAAWIENGGGDITRDTATSMISGKTAMKLTADNTTRSLAQNISTFSGGSETFAVLVEQGDSADCDVDIYDVTGVAVVYRMKFTFGTESVSDVTGTPSKKGVIPLGPGQNGSDAYIIWCTIDTTAVSGSSRRIRFFPAPSSANQFTYAHHFQYTQNAFVSSPIVTAGTSLASTGETLSFSSPSWYSGGGDLSIVAHVSAFGDLTANSTPFLALVYDGVGNETNQLFRFGASLVAKQEDSPAAAQQALTSGGWASTDTDFKVAASYSGSDVAISVKGNTAVSAGAAAGQGASLTEFVIGSAGPSNLQCGAIIHRIQFIPRALTTAELQAASA